MLVFTPTMADPATRGLTGLVGLGMVLWIAVFVTVGLWSRRASMEYQRLYRARVDPDVPTSEEIAKRSSRNPGRWFVEAPRLLWRLNRIHAMPQADPELEAARLEAERRYWVTVVALFVGMVIPMILAAVGT